MDAITKQIRTFEKKEATRIEHERKLQMQNEQSMYAKKLKATSRVLRATQAALTAQHKRFLQKGTVVSACTTVGPHNCFWRGYHKRTITVLPIKHSRAAHSYMYETYGYLYIGSDGFIYRYGRGSKLYRADLMSRKTAGSIRALAEKIEAMNKRA